MFTAPDSSMKIARSRRRGCPVFGSTPAIAFLILLALSAPLAAQLPGTPGSAPAGGPNALSGSAADCADPLMAGTPQCFGLLQQSTSQMGAAGIMTMPASLPAARNYSDVEQLTKQPMGRTPLSTAPPEPLTEFQKFIAATTGQVLPIYGVDLFQGVPATFAPVNLTPVPPDYVIGPGDELRIRIWGQVNTQDNVRVDRTGDVYLPQVGPIHVAGLPFSELESHLRQAIGRVYKNFDLTVDLGQIRSIQVYVTGEARRPGVYTVSSLSTLVNAIFASGGPSVEGSLRRIELRRGGSTITSFDLYDLLLRGDKSKDAKLQDGDVIYIPPVGPQAAITGSVRSPGIYELASGESLRGLLEYAGGVTAVASSARISVERTEDRRSREAMEIADDAVGLTTKVKNGDLVRVYSIVPAYQKTVMLRGNVANPGRFAWHPGMRISDLIPDKNSLLTRNYWWRRARLGLPTPEFQPIPALEYMHQPSAGYPARVPLQAAPNAALEAGAQQSPAAAGAGGGGAAGNAGALGNQAAGARGALPAAGMAAAYMNGYGQPGYGTPPNPEQNQTLPAKERASEATIAAGQSTLSTVTRPPAKPLRVRLSAPEIDWDYALIQRLNPKTLKTEFIPFDLGKLVMDHDASQNLELQPGDVVTIFSEADIREPIAQQTKLVWLEGEFVHSGVYTVGPGETLRDLVQRAGGFTPNAYLYGSEFTRESTRAIQQQRIDEYVQNMNLSMQRGILDLAASPAVSAQDMASSAAASNVEQRLLADLKRIRATGRIVLEFKPGSRSIDSVPDIPLEDGDRFIVPPSPATVNVVGAVFDQNAFLYHQGQNVNSYLRLAGGPTKDADRGQAFLIRADGEVVSHGMASGPWGNEFNNLPVYPGDTILIPDKTLRPSTLRGVLDWTLIYSQIASQAAISAEFLTLLLP